MNYSSSGTTKRKAVVYDDFRSVDYSSGDTRAYRSPDALNMITDKYGKVRRRMGYESFYTGSTKIYGIYKFKGNFLIHDGVYLKLWDGTTATTLLSTLNAAKSWFYSYNGVVYVFDGATIYTVEEDAFGTISAAETVGKIPTITIAGVADTAYGGGTTYEQSNLISNTTYQEFTVPDLDSHSYYSVFYGFNPASLTVQKYDSGDWSDLSSTVAYVGGLSVGITHDFSITAPDKIRFKIVYEKTQVIKSPSDFTYDSGADYYYVASAFNGFDPNNTTVEFLIDGEWVKQKGYHEGWEDYKWRVLATGGYNYRIRTTTAASDNWSLTGWPTADNSIRITYCADANEIGRIAECTTFLPFGINGVSNQIFATGNPDYPNEVYWCDVNDPTYWGDLQFAVLGTDDSSVVTLNRMSGYLAVHKDANEGNTYLCTVALAAMYELLVPQITISKTIGGTGCKAPYVSAYFNSEPIFMSSTGLKGVTYADIYSNQVATDRSLRVNEKMINDEDLGEAVSVIFQNFLLVSFPTTGNVYAFDQRQPESDGNSTYSSSTYSRQYNAFWWNNIPAYCWYSDNDERLYFGAGASVYRFFDDPDDVDSYTDAIAVDGSTVIKWYWEFPEYTGQLFYSNKSIKYVAMRAKAYQQCAVAIDVMLDGLWYPNWNSVLVSISEHGYFDLNNLDMENLNLSTDTTNQLTSERFLARRLDKFKFRVRALCGALDGDNYTEAKTNLPFGLDRFAFEVKENGKHR